jgi:hypothetical protein
MSWMLGFSQLMCTVGNTERKIISSISQANQLQTSISFIKYNQQLLIQIHRVCIFKEEDGAFGTAILWSDPVSVAPPSKQKTIKIIAHQFFSSP